MTSFTSQCSNCARFWAGDRINNSCAAFPLGIPDAIAYNERSHLTPVDGDRGLAWQPTKDGDESPFKK